MSKLTLPDTFTYSATNDQPALFSELRPFLPMGRTLTFFDEFSRSTCIARRSTFELNAPARERSPVTTTTRIFSSGRRSSSGCAVDSMRAAAERNTRRISWAYGRAAKTPSCERRSFAAATNFIARVICCVLFTERMRRRKSRSVAIDGQRSARDRRGRGLRGSRGGQESFLERLESLEHIGLESVVDRLLLSDRLQDPVVVRLNERVQFPLEFANL